MGYVYDEVKNQLDIDQKGSKSTWSPNIYRCIIIGADYLFFAYHGGIKKNRIVRLDPEKVVGDIRKSEEGKYRGSINNLLQERQLSCLEEIYVDTAYQRFPNIFDIAKYADSVKSNVSRLRYIGYCTTSGDMDWLITSYDKENPIYTLAEDKTKRGLQLQVTKINNPEWYKKYYLRSQFYDADKENGKIAVWFRKNQKRIEEMLSESERAKLEQDNIKKLREIINVDMENSKYILQLARVMGYAKNPKTLKGVVVSDKEANILAKAITKTIGEGKPVSGFSMSVFNRLYTNDKTVVGPLFKLFKVLDKEENSGKFDKKQICDVYNSHSGFFNINGVLDNICFYAFQEHCKEDNFGAKLKAIGLVNGSFGDAFEVIPKGKFRDLLAQKLGKPEYAQSSAQSPKGYFLYISSLLGTKRIYEEL